MGLGFSFVSDRPAAALPALGVLAQRLTTGLGSELLERYAWTRPIEGGFEVSLYMHEEPVFLRTTDDRRVLIEGRTSSAGPGYHVFAVERALALAEAFEFEWITDDEELEALDEAGFAAHRSLERTQEAHLEQLQAVARFVTTDPSMRDAENLVLAMPVSPRPHFEGAVATLRGARDRGFLRALAEAQGGELRALAAQYFPWWDAGFGPAFEWGWAETALWQDLSWVRPTDEREERLVRDVLDCFASAEAAGLTPPPTSELRGELLASLERDGAPPPGLPGYRRGPTTWTLYPGWRIDVEGWYQRWTEEGDTVWQFAERSVRASTYTYEGDGVPFEFAGAPFDVRIEGATCRFERIAEAEPDMLVVRGAVCVPGQAIVLTIVSEPGADAWIRERLESIVPPSVPDEERTAS